MITDKDLRFILMMQIISKRQVILGSFFKSKPKKGITIYTLAINLIYENKF
jgi:hypothetical protein